MATITDITTWFQRNSAWIKTVVILLLIGFLILAVTNAGCVRKQRDKFIAQTTTLHILNDSILAQNKALQNYVVISQVEKDQHYRHILILTKENDSLVILSNSQRKKISQISSDVAKMKSDSVYKHLTVVAYPDTGKVVFPFSDNQIRRIEETYFRTIALQQLIEILDKQINNSLLRFMSMDSLVESYRVTNINLTTQNTNLSQVVTNKDKEIGLYKKQETQANRKSLLFEITTAVASVIALIFVFK